MQRKNCKIYAKYHALNAKFNTVKRGEKNTGSLKRKNLIRKPLHGFETKFCMFSSPYSNSPNVTYRAALSCEVQ